MHMGGGPDPTGHNVEVIDLQAMLADLELLVNTESPSLDVPRLTVSALALAGVMERRLGSAPQIIDGPAGPHVHWSGGGTPKVLIVGHHDTVFPVGSCAARPFTVADGRATGPGIFDMKTGVVQAVHAVASLADRGGVEILITADEEVGSGTSRALLEERALACGNVLVCEASADGGALKTARKGTGGYEVIVHGKAAHAGLEPEKGINSLVAAAELILQINTFGDPATATTVTPTVASAGTADNVVPAQARIRVDVRVEQPGEAERLAAAFSSLTTSVPGATIEVRGGVDRPPMPSSASAALFPVAVAAGAAIGFGEVVGVGVGGGSDGNFTAAVGVPTLDGLGAVGGGAHADHEYVLIDTMVPRAQLLAAIITRI